MNIYLVERTDEPKTYDEYISFICYAEDEIQAMNTHPAGIHAAGWQATYSAWVKHPKLTTATYLGTNDSKFISASVILTDFKAG